MSNLSEKQLKNRWRDIKKLIKERPLLAYKTNIPLEKWEDYINSIPKSSEINRIYYAIHEDRKKKTHRIKEELSKIVGYRETKYFSKKIGISDTTIRDIIEGKKEMAGYDVINKLELFLHAINPEFEPSIENPLDIIRYTQDQISKITAKIKNIADSLEKYCFKLTNMANNMQRERDF